MVFIKFHNMNRKKKNSNVAFKLKLKKFFHFTTSQNNVTITVHKCSVFFSSVFFNLCTVYFTENVCSFFLFFPICCVQQCSSFSFFFPFCLFFIVLYVFVFIFIYFLLFFLSFFFIINCSFNVSFFFSTLYLPPCLFLNMITKGSPPILFNFSLQYHKLSLIYNTTFSIAYEHSPSFYFFSLNIPSFFFLNNPNFKKFCQQFLIQNISESANLRHTWFCQNFAHLLITSKTLFQNIYPNNNLKASLQGELTKYLSATSDTKKHIS